MDTLALRQAYLAGQLTIDETYTKLRNWSDHTPTVNALVRAWDLIRGLQAELKATRAHAKGPMISRDTIADLIDHAFSTDHLHDIDAEVLHTLNGMLNDVAKTHIETLAAIKNKDAERAKYLDDPDTAIRYCTRCGIQAKAEHLSTRALCAECSATAVEQAAEQLQAKGGPVYHKWRDAMIAYCYKLENEIIAATRDREPSTLGDMIDKDMPLCDNGECLNCVAPECDYRTADYNPDVPDHHSVHGRFKLCPNCDKTISFHAIHCECCDTGIHDWQNL